MGLFGRLVGGRARDVWRAEGRILDRLGRVRPPVAVQWITTSACDLHCPHCYSRAGRRSPGELTTEEAKRLVVDELVALGRPLLVLAGGETLLRRDIGDIVAHAAARGVPWSLHTHGGAVEHLAAVLARHPPALAAVSLDGPREVHDAFRGRAGSFDAALGAIATLKR